MSEEVEYYEDITAEIYNLSAAYSTLLEIDTMMYDDEDQERLKRMKESLFKALERRCEALDGEE